MGGRIITNLQFANDKDALAEEKQELDALAENIDKTCSSIRWKLMLRSQQ